MSIDSKLAMKIMKACEQILIKELEKRVAVTLMNFKDDKKVEIEYMVDGKEYSREFSFDEIGYYE